MRGPRFKIKHEGPEEWENMWQKSRAIWKYINFHYKDDFDWFILGGDDIFIIVENLRKVLLQPLECFLYSRTEQQKRFGFFLLNFVRFLFVPDPFVYLFAVSAVQ